MTVEVDWPAVSEFATVSDAGRQRSERTLEFGIRIMLSSDLGPLAVMLHDLSPVAASGSDEYSYTASEATALCVRTLCVWFNVGVQLRYNDRYCRNRLDSRKEMIALTLIC